MGSVCVDGKTLGSSATTVTRGAQLLDVSCFYVGGDGCSGSGSSQVTLAHFCLCNRPLTRQELQMSLLRGKQTEADCKEGKATLCPGNFLAKLPQDLGIDAAAGEAVPVPAKRGNLARETAPLMPMALLFYCSQNELVTVPSMGVCLGHFLPLLQGVCGEMAFL
ncbi:trans-sialidase [Trypanosoma cruzi]|nr:trans-sialidase [Trypanosoma cruzi]